MLFKTFQLQYFPRHKIIFIYIIYFENISTIKTKDDAADELMTVRL
jgi:hypothetical protein